MGKKPKAVPLHEFVTKANSGASGAAGAAGQSVGGGANKNSKKVDSTAWGQGSPANAVDAVEQPSPTASPSLAPHPAAVKAAQEALKLGEPEIDTCFICTDPITWYSLGNCNHPICHLCSLRLRGLLKDQNCPLCKTQLPSVVFTGDRLKTFGDFLLDNMKMDRKLSIFFDSREAYDDVMILLQFNCPDPNCEVACPEGWAELKRHVQRAHKSVLCDLCIKHKKLFTHEHQLYTQQELEKHFKVGDGGDSSFKGHPKCGFCHIAFYGDDELYEHCKKNHEQCFLCTRAGIRHQYYENYSRLDDHFRKGHFACLESECIEKKFQVFATDIDLTAHELEVHPSKRAGNRRGKQIEVNITYANGPTRDLGPRKGKQRESNYDASSSSSNQRQQLPPGFGAGLTQTPPVAAEGPPLVPDQPPPEPAQWIGATQQTESWPELSTARPKPAPVIAPSAPKSDFPALQSSKPKTDHPALASSSSSRSQPVPKQTPSSPVIKPSDWSATTAKSSPSQADDEISVILRKVPISDSNLLYVKEQGKRFRDADISASEFLDKFMTCALQGQVSERGRRAAEVTAGKAWVRLADTLPEDPQGSNASKQEAMLKAWRDYKIKNAPEEVVVPISTSYSSTAGRPGLTNVTVESVQKPSGPSRVLVIKSTASKQRTNSTAWTSVSNGRAFVSTVSMTSNNSPARSTPKPSSAASSSNVPMSSLIEIAHPDFVIEHNEPAPVTPSSVRYATGGSRVPKTTAEFPGLPTRKTVPKVGNKSQGAQAWGSSPQPVDIPDEEPVIDSSNAKKKKGKTVLMKVGL